LREEYNALVARFNRMVPKYNAVVAPRGMGRPLAASDQQRAMVMRLHKAGTSLRGIAAQTGLGIRTVRTITEGSTGADRTSLKSEASRQRELHKARMTSYRARKRTRDALPKRINELLKNGPALMKRAR
jgi:transposase